MKKSIHYSRVFLSIALVFCMFFSMMNIVDAGSYTNTLYPVGPNSKNVATRTLSPETHTIKIYISDGKNGSSLKKESLPKWIKIDSSNSYYYSATIDPNSNTSARKGSIIFTKGTNKYELDITQNPFLVKNSSGTPISSLGFIVAGETKTIYTTYSCEMKKSDSDWFTVTKNGNNYTIKVKPNINSTSRKGKLTFTKQLSQNVKVSREVTINQSGNSIIGVPSSKYITDVGKTFSFTVSTGYGTVQAKLGNTYSWLHVSQNGNTITVTCDPNVMLTERSGKVIITIGDIIKTCTVTQRELTFDTDLQDNITSDTWSSKRIDYLTKFYNGLIIGASNTSNSKCTSYVVKNAKYLTVFPWTPNSFAYGYRVNDKSPARDFEAGHTYYGLPYQQTDQAGKNTSDYFHYGNVKTLAGFKDKVNDTNYHFGKIRPGLNGSLKSCDSLGPRCGIDCSSFVSYCTGAKYQQSAATFYANAGKKYEKLDYKTDIQPGDILWRSGHVLLVASVVKEGSTIKGLVLLESRGRTTASGRCLYVFYNSAATLSKMFGDMSISECRSMLRYLITINDGDYDHIGTVTTFINSFNSKHTLLKTNSLRIDFKSESPYY